MRLAEREKAVVTAQGLRSGGPLARNGTERISAA
jgi:hypothetical protein